MIPFIAQQYAQGGPVGTPFSLTECISCEVAEELNGEYTLQVELPTKYIRGIADEIMTSMDADAARRKEYLYDMVIACAPNNAITIPQPFRILDFSESGGVTTIHAGHISYDLNNIAIVGGATTGSASSIQFIANLINQNWAAWTGGASRFQFQTDITFPFYEAIDFGAVTLRELCKDIFTQKQYGGAELYWSDFTVYLLQRRGLDRGVTLYRGVDYTIDAKNQDANGCVNGILPFYTYQAQSQGIVTGNKVFVSPQFFFWANSSLSTDRRRKTLPVDFTDTIGDAIPSSATQQRLAQMAQAYIDANAQLYNYGYSIALHLPNEKDKPLFVGDTIKLNDVEFDGTGGEARITKIVYDALHERTLAISIGTPEKSVGDIIWTR